jgi:hypothetical protein
MSNKLSHLYLVPNGKGTGTISAGNNGTPVYTTGQK